jgi:hypothetical protein
LAHLILKNDKKMKTVLVWLAIMLQGACAWAQQNTSDDDDKPQTLMGQRMIRKSNGYGTGVAKFSTINNQFAVLAGAYGGWFINDTWMIGGGAYALVKEISAPKPDNLNPLGRTAWNMGYGGFMLEYTANSKSLIHCSFNTLLGWGLIEKKVSHSTGSDSGWDEGYDRSNFFVAEPGANVELNVTEHFRIGAGISYRWVSGSKTSGITDEKLSAPSAQVILKFGGF